MSSKQVMALVESQRNQIAVALPAGVDVDRIERMTRTVLATNDFLAKCDPVSILGAVIECAQLGLEPGITGHLVPFKDNKANVWKAQMIADYRGLMALARRTGEIASITADVVREDDGFEYARGAEPHLRHWPKLGATGEVIAAYAVAHWRDSSNTQFEVVDAAAINKVRDAALGKIRNETARKYSPWSQHYEEMAKKTAVRRLCKYLPFSTEAADLQRAIVLDEAADRGEQRPGAAVIDVTPTLEPDAPESEMSEADRAALSDAINGAAK